MKKGFILGFLTAIAVYVVVAIVIPIINLEKNFESIALEAFSMIGDSELELTFETEERIDLSKLHRASAEDIASFFAQENEEKKAQYLAVLESGLQVEITVKHHDGASTSYDSIFYPHREIGGMKSYSAFSSATITTDSEPIGVEELLKQIKSNQTGDDNSE